MLELSYWICVAVDKIYDTMRYDTIYVRSKAEEMASLIQRKA